MTRLSEVEVAATETARQLRGEYVENCTWATNAHPFAPGGVAMAVGSADSTSADHRLRWDNSGKNAHYAPINWSS